MQDCKHCGDGFEVTERDLVYYERIGVPEPGFCPSCRMQRRMAFRNERHLYKDNCAMCKKEIISMYSVDKGFRVFCQDCWWGGDWDGKEHGMDFDFGRNFAEQFQELQKKVPRIAALNVNRENSEYCNMTGDVKNSYLIFGSVYSEDCMYGSPYYSKDCIDTLVVRDCELCYECTDCRKLYNCKFCQDCVNGADLTYCYDLQGCQDCIGCSGLRKKQYCVFNEVLGKEKYEEFKSEMDLDEIKKKFEQVKAKSPRRFMQMAQVENVSGDHVYNSKNTFHSFFADRCEDCAYCAQVVDLKDCYDNNFTEENELCYEYLGMYATKNVFFSLFCRHAYDVLYSEHCVNTKNCFGCSNLRDAEYCILNKQYTKEEYEELKGRIIEHMKETGEWGEFFPAEISPFSYEETVAQEYFPIEVDETEEKPFKLLDKELKFYERMGVPAPKKHPDVRHQERLALRNPRKLWSRECNKCGAGIETSYSPERPETVYCEACYLAEVY